MCGIVGYVGSRNSSDVLVEGLRRLEYRGYDSCGIASVKAKGGLYLKRVSGRIEALKGLVDADPPRDPGAGIGHTRWATHGVPSEDNAHPHTDCAGEMVLVHNGIIENYLELREKLSGSGHAFKSETDTEAAVHLLERNVKELSARSSSGLLEPVFFEAFRRTLAELKGSFAIAAVWDKCPGVVMTARMHSPLVLGLGEGENFVASDVSAFLKFTRRAVFLNDGDIAVVRAGGAEFFDFAGRKARRDSVNIQWDSTMAEKGGYRHFMLKEIHEQAASVENTLRGRLLPLKEDTLAREINLDPAVLRSVKTVQFIACGTAYHAGLVGKYALENFQVPAHADLASEYSDRSKLAGPDTLAVAISQSGETADTIHAVREAKAAGARVLAITNTVGSTLTREADWVLYTHCGPEIGVASTKAFVGQLAAIYVLAAHFAAARKAVFDSDARAFAAELLKVPRLIEDALAMEKEIEALAKRYADREHFLFIARHINYPIALEGALKIKEISYVHAEGYAAGEMKHGPIAIIDKGMPVLAVATSSRALKLMAGNMQEAGARGAEVVAIVDRESRGQVRASRYIEVPRAPEILSPLVNVIPLQLFSYYSALARGCDIDKPRNLAKSVTVR